MTTRHYLRRLGLKKARIAPARLWFERTVLALTRPEVSPERPRILCYHSIGTPRWGVDDVSPSAFRRQLEAALDLGYSFVPIGDITDGIAGPKSLALTFDDGVKSVLDSGLPILRELNIPFTVFVVTDWLDGKHRFGDGLMLSWRDLEQLAAAGCGVGSHSVSHPNFAWLSAEQATLEMAESRESIERHLGVLPDSFAIPMGRRQDWNEEASRIATTVGYRRVFSQSEERRPVGTIPRTFITRSDTQRLFRAAILGKFDKWEEWT